VRRKELAEKIVEKFFWIYDEPDASVCLKAYRERSVLQGKRVYITINNKEAETSVLGIGEDFSLLVRTAEGETRSLRSGEVRVRPAL